MKPITIYVQQPTTTTYSSYFTWGEGMKEVEHTEYGTLSVYIDDLSIPPRLIADLQEILKNTKDLSSFTGHIKQFTNRDLVRFNWLSDNAATDHLINIKSIDPIFNGVSIYSYSYTKSLTSLAGYVSIEYHKLPKQLHTFRESIVLSALGLNFDEGYLPYVKKEYFKEYINHLLKYTLNTIITQKYRVSLEGISQFNRGVIEQKLHSICIDSNNEYEFLTKTSIEYTIKEHLHKCEEFYLDEKLDSLLSNDRYFNQVSVCNFLHSIYGGDNTPTTYQIQAFGKRYISKWIEKHDYIEKIKSTILSEQNFLYESAYKDFLRQYLEKSSEGFDQEMIETIINLVFENFVIPPRHIKTEVPKVELKILGKIDLSKYKK